MHSNSKSESYAAAGELINLCGYSKEEIAAGKFADIQERFEKLNAEETAQSCGVGVPTLLDLVKELSKPGRDPRDDLPAPILRTDVLEMKDLTEGMILKGTVRNVIDFGVFVDIGVHQDGLVHISQMADRYIKNPSEVVSVGDIVKVKVIGIDREKQKVSLSMKLYAVMST